MNCGDMKNYAIKILFDVSSCKCNDMTLCTCTTEENKEVRMPIACLYDIFFRSSMAKPLVLLKIVTEAKLVNC